MIQDYYETYRQMQEREIEKQQKVSTYFLSDVKMLTEILSGLHPSSDLKLDNKEVPA